jgi:hypothetical protein
MNQPSPTRVRETVARLRQEWVARAGQGVALVALLLGAAWPAEAKPEPVLEAFPPVIQLDSAKARQRLVVQATDPDGVTRDVTLRAAFKVSDQKVARFDRGSVIPLTNGQTELRVTYAGHTAILPVVVSNATLQPPISFRLDVMPVFTRAGCNSGACHGTSRGKDGFHLSLFGFDPEGDYYRLTREQIGRRIDLGIPEESLIVQKGLGAVQHTGGVRFATNSDLCRTLIGWLAAGAPNDPTNVAQPTAIEIFPKAALLEGSNSLQHFIVQARYSDGTARDVTPLAVFLGNNEGVARVSAEGSVTAGQRGEAFIQARFAQFNVGAEVIVIPKGSHYRWPTNVTAQNYIDEAVYTKLKKLRLVPSDVCDDRTFLRRAFIDLTGTLPTAEDLRTYEVDNGPNRHERLVDQLLSRPQFMELWVMKLAELLQIRSRGDQVYPKAALGYYEWLRDQMLTNVPLDQIVRDLLTASGSTLRDPAANYYQIEPDTLKLAENTVQVFMGTRIQCAQCHNHPFDRWTLNDYYGFAAFFTQVGRKPGDDPRETVIYDRSEGEVKHPVTGAVMRPKYLGGDTPEMQGESRREALAHWLTSPQNPYFARNLANLVWAHFLGRGIIEPVDDARLSNPAVNPQLLDALAAKLVDYKYDLKKLVRDICTSRTYQLSTVPNQTNGSDERNFSKASIRRMQAEVLLDCISQVTETQDKFPGLPRGARAIEIPDGNTANYFLTTFGRASRTTVCSCEVKVDPNLSQALHLLNGNTIERKIEQGEVVNKLLKAGKKPEEIIESLYLRCLAREPTPDELKKLEGFLEGADKPEQVLNDVFWSLLNAKEFVFNH